MNRHNENTHFDRLDNVRKELDAKIADKVSRDTFFALLSLFLVIISGAIGYAFFKIDHVHDYVGIIKSEVIILKPIIQERGKTP